MQKNILEKLLSSILFCRKWECFNELIWVRALPTTRKNMSWINCKNGIRPRYIMSLCCNRSYEFFKDCYKYQMLTILSSFQKLNLSPLEITGRTMTEFKNHSWRVEIDPTLYTWLIFFTNFVTFPKPFGWPSGNGLATLTWLEKNRLSFHIMMFPNRTLPAFV